MRAAASARRRSAAPSASDVHRAAAMRKSSLPLLVLGGLTIAALPGCGGEIDGGGQSTLRTEEGLSGCHGVASSSIPASGDYFLTTFGYSPSDDGTMSCGSKTLHG